jgi:hypothetical protein
MKKKEQVTFAYAKLLDRILPLERGERYEDPLQEALELRGFGEITGGGTMQHKNGEIEYCGIDLSLSDLDESTRFVCSFLEERGAARGSCLEISPHRGEKKVVPFGVAEGLGIYLDGVNLPDEVYRECDINVVCEEFSRLLEGEGEIRGHWQGPTETTLYICTFMEAPGSECGSSWQTIWTLTHFAAARELWRLRRGRIDSNRGSRQRFYQASVPIDGWLNIRVGMVTRFA